MLKLNEFQIDAINRLKTGSILWGGVGSGKSRTALGYFYFRECQGRLPINGKGSYQVMKYPKDLYIITTAKKRDSLEWLKECSIYSLSSERENSVSGIQVVVDSWNNISKYTSVINSFFIFDEQRLVGYGSWVKSFLKISKNNNWILLTATPGDKWSDYIPVFIANGFYKNKTDFTRRHCVYNRYTKYPKIERYLFEAQLRKYRDILLVPLESNKTTIRHNKIIVTDYDKDKYKIIFKDRWNPYDNEPIQEYGKLGYLLRMVGNSDPSRINKIIEVMEESKCSIIFYNFRYEAEIIRQACNDICMPYAEWNGDKHEECPVGKRWVYMLQYTAGSEGWNCITSDTIIFYSPNYSYRLTEQASGRIDRMNTPFIDLYYYHFRSASPIDIAIHRALKKKKDFNERSFISVL